MLPDLRVHTPRPLRHPQRVQEARTKGKNERKGVGGDLQSPSGFPCPPCTPSWHHTCCTFCLVSGIPSGHPRQEGAPRRACLLPGAASQELPRGGGQGRRAYPPGDTHTGGGAGGEAQRSTYSPFLLARRARLRQSFVLLFNLGEQTKKSLGGQGREAEHQKHRRQTSKGPLLPRRQRSRVFRSTGVKDTSD